MKKWVEMTEEEREDLMVELANLDDDDFIDVWNSWKADDIDSQIFGAGQIRRYFDAVLDKNGENYEDLVNKIVAVFGKEKNWESKFFFTYGNQTPDFFYHKNECKIVLAELLEYGFSRIAQFVATDYANEEIKRLLTLKKMSVAELDKIIKLGDTVMYTEHQSPDLFDDGWENSRGIFGELAYHFGDVEAIDGSYVHHSPDYCPDESYKVVPTAEEREKLVLLCQQYQTQDKAVDADKTNDNLLEDIDKAIVALQAALKKQ